ncbi:MAG: four helix bundle protein [Patescibacteria group bacterium]
MKENIALDKSYQFALKIIKLYFYLSKEKHEFVISKQVLRSGTAIGANSEEAVAAISKADFINKVQIALKEARETDYWLRLIRDSKLIEFEESDSL